MVIVPFLLGNSAPAVQAVNPVMKSPNIVVILADDLVSTSFLVGLFV